MRIPLREVSTPASLVSSSQQPMMLSHEFASIGPWVERLHARPEGADALSSSKARARRLAAMLGQMHRSRAHGHNAALSPLASRW